MRSEREGAQRARRRRALCDRAVRASRSPPTSHFCVSALGAQLWLQKRQGPALREASITSPPPRFMKYLCFSAANDACRSVYAASVSTSPRYSPTSWPSLIVLLAKSPSPRSPVSRTHTRAHGLERACRCSWRFEHLEPSAQCGLHSRFCARLMHPSPQPMPPSAGATHAHSEISSRSSARSLRWTYTWRRITVNSHAASSFERRPPQRSSSARARCWCSCHSPRGSLKSRGVSSIASTAPSSAGMLAATLGRGAARARFAGFQIALYAARMSRAASSRCSGSAGVPCAAISGGSAPGSSSISLPRDPTTRAPPRARGPAPQDFLQNCC